MKEIFTAAKYHGRWAVYDRTSCTFHFIGFGKKFCMKVAKELNESKEKQNAKE